MFRRRRSPVLVAASSQFKTDIAALWELTDWNSLLAPGVCPQAFVA